MTILAWSGRYKIKELQILMFNSSFTDFPLIKLPPETDFF